ncbi:Fibronectin type III domain protein [compost metagenome]
MKKLLLIPLKVVKKTCLLSMICGFAATVSAQQVSESFESPIFPPQEWTATAAMYYPGWKSNAGDASHGSRAAYITNRDGAGPDARLIAPKVELLANETVEITFDYKVLEMEKEFPTDPDPLPATLSVTQGNNTTNTAQSVIEAISLPGVSSYATKTVTFTAVQSGTYYFGFYLISPNHQVFRFVLDKVTINKVGSCLKPTNISTAALSATGVTVNWNAQVGITSWQVQSTQGELPKEGNWNTVTTNQAVLANLIQGTAYTTYVRAVCADGSHSSLSDPISFTTTCADVVNAPYTVPFTAGNIPGCWEQNGPTVWSFDTLAGYDAINAGDHSVLHGYTNYAWMDASVNTNDKVSTLISPTVNISGLTNPAVEFYVFSENTFNQIFNELKIEVYNGTTWQTVATLASSSGGWKFYSIGLTELGIINTTKIRFTVTGKVDGVRNDILIDDVVFKEKTTCLPASGITMPSVTDNSAKLSWTSGNTGGTWDIAYGVYNFIFDGTANITSTNIPYTLDGLESATTYDYYVRANCGNGNLGEWTGPYRFTTGCSVAATPYNEPFTGITDYPYGFYAPGLMPCWQSASGGDATTGPLEYGTEDWTASSYSLYGPYTNSQDVITNIYEPNQTSWLLSPWIDLSQGEHEMVVRIALTHPIYYLTNLVNMGSDDAVEILYTVDGATWQSLKKWTIEDGLTSGYHSFLISLENITGANIQFAFFTNSGNVKDSRYTFHVDDLTIRPKLPCPEPLNLTADGITHTSAKLGWDAYNGISSWKVAIVGQGVPPADWITVNTNPYKAIDLLPNTTYDYYVKSNCLGVDDNIVSGPFTFTTRCEPIVAPYTETFAEQALPECWLAAPKNYEDGFIFIYYWNFNLSANFDAAAAGDHTADGGTNYAWVNMANLNDKEKSTLNTPLVDVSALQKPALNFYAYSKNTFGSSVNKLQIEIYTGEEWVLATTITGLTNNWAPYTIDLSNYTITGPIEARFTIIVNTNGGDPSYNTILIDDVSFMEMSDCPVPFNITTTEITETTAIVEWEIAIESDWELEYGPTGFTPGNGTVITIENGTPFTNLSDLTPEMAYDVYVKSICDPEGELVGPHKFTTDTILGNGEIVKNNVTLYPNPVKSNLTIKADDFIGTVVVYNIYGQKITEQLFDTYTATIDFSSFSSGIYLVKVVSGSKEKTFKIIKD